MDIDGPDKNKRIAYAYSFNANTPFWRYIFIGALTPFVTLKIMGRLQNRTIHKWQYTLCCFVGGYLGAKRAFHSARVAIDPDAMPQMDPFFQHFKYQIQRHYPNHHGFRSYNDHYSDKQRPKPSLDTIVDNEYMEYKNPYDDPYDDRYNDRHEDNYDIVKRRQRGNRNSYEDYNSYDDYSTSNNNRSYDPTQDIAEFFESNEKHKQHRKR